MKGLAAIPAEECLADNVVVRRALREPEAFTELFDRYAEDVHRYVTRRLGPDAADDVMAETFAVAFARRARFDLSRPEPEADRITARLTAQAARGELAAAVARLSAHQRDVLLLHAWAELDYEQIAEALGVPIGTVRSRLHRARAVLREALATAGLRPNERGDDSWTS